MKKKILIIITCIFSNHAFSSSLTAAFIYSMDSTAKPRKTVWPSFSPYSETEFTFTPNFATYELTIF
jgi:hypothetical protein